jgi:hypothetical protein
MALLIEIAKNNPDSNGNIVANYRDNSGSNTDADIKVYINNSVSGQTIPVSTKLTWQSIVVKTVVSAPGYNVHVRVDIMPRNSDVVSMSDNQYFSNYM